MTAEFGNALLKMAGSLGLVIGLILLFVYLMKRFRIGPLSLNRSPAFKLLGSLSLAPKRSIALVEIRNQWLILGVGTDRVNLLSRMDRPEEDVLPGSQYGYGQKSFGSLMQDFARGKRNPAMNDRRRDEDSE